MIYYLIAGKLFNKDKNSIFLFLIILNIIFMWGGYSGRPNFAFFYYRIWQGKAIIANIILPAVWLLFIMAEENKFKLIDFLLLLMINFAGCFTTTMSVALIPISLMVLVGIYEISKISFKEKNEFKFFSSLKNIGLCLLSCLPSIIYGLVYIMHG